MTAIERFVAEAKRRLERRNAVIWGARGVAVAAVGALLVGLVARRAAVAAPWGPTSIAVGLGALVALAGWVRARPSPREVAEVADQRLGGQARLATALELAGNDGALASRQRSDAEQWAGQADPAGVAGTGWPRRVLTVAAVALVGAVGLAVTPNPGIARVQQAEAAALARERAAAEVQAEIERQEQAPPSEQGSARATLIQELRKAQLAVRTAPTASGAVAALSRSQAALRRLTASESAAAAAAAALTSGTAAAAVAGEPAAGSPEQQQAEAERQRPPAAGQPPAGSSAGQAADGQSAAEQSAAELARLAESLPTLSPAEQAALAKALARAAAAAIADPELARQLRQAGDRLSAGDLAKAGAAIDAAAQELARAAGQARLAGDAARADRALQAAKKSLLPKSGLPGPECQEDDQAAPPDKGGNKRGAEDRASPPPEPADEACSSSEGESDGGSAGLVPGDGSGDGRTAVQGEGGGSGQGSGGGNQGQRGGGATGGGAQGKAVGPPGRPSEKVFVPALPGPGRSQELAPAGGSGGSGGSTELIPYESVYAEYRAAAMSQVEREPVPAEVQTLLLRYFAEAAP